MVSKMIVLMQRRSLKQNTRLIPMIAIPSIETLLRSVEDYVRELRPLPAITATPLLPTTLLAAATTTAPEQPLAEHFANVMSDICCSIRSLEVCATTSEGQEMLAEYLGREQAHNVIKFWG